MKSWMTQKIKQSGTRLFVLAIHCRNVTVAFVFGN